MTTRRILTTLKRATVRALEGLLALLMGVLVLDVLWQVTSRYVLGRPSSLTDELATLLTVWVVSIGACVAFARGSHLGVDVVVARMPEGIRVWVDLGVHGLIAVFAAGIVPGLLFGLALMGTAWWTSRRMGTGTGTTGGAGTAGPRPAFLPAFGRAIWSLSLILLVLGGILGGVFTATEAAAVAVAYSGLLALGVYREVRWGELPGILLQAGITTGVVFLLIATSMAMSWILALEDVPIRASQALLAWGGNPVLVLLLINVLLLAVGTFMDMTPAVLIFTPILGPVAAELGMDPVHFGIMMIANLCIGLCTPPVGTCLFVGCGVGRVSLAGASRAAIPFVAALVAALAAIALVPELSLWLPGLLGMR